MSPFLNKIFGSQLIARVVFVLMVVSWTSAPQSVVAQPNTNANEPDPKAADGETEKIREEADKLLPKLAEMEIPTAAQLLQERPVDWIVLSRNDELLVLVVEPISPRPGTLSRMKAELQASYKWPPAATPEGIEQQRLQRRRLHYLDVVLAGGGDDTVYQLDIEKYPREIIHHEDLMLRRVDLLLQDHKRREAYELLLVLDRQQPNWPGFAERRNRLMFVEAVELFKNQEAERAFSALEQLHGWSTDYPGLSQQMGEVADALITTAVDNGDYRRARHFLARLYTRQPEQPVALNWRQKLLDQSNTLLDQSQQATQKQDHRQATLLAEQAALVWPKNPILGERHRRAAARFQILRVGHAGQPMGLPNRAVDSFADRRRRQLTEVALFDIDRSDEITHYRTDLFEEWEPTDLGRRIDFTLRATRNEWESQPVSTAATIGRELALRITPGDDLYDERLASYIESIAVKTPFDFTISFSRVPVRTEAALSLPLLHNSAVGSLQAAEPATSTGGLLPRFYPRAETEQRLSFFRSIPEPPAQVEYHVGEIQEVAYASHEAAVQGLLRGEVSALTRVPTWFLDRLEATGDYFTRPYALPTTHVIQFNPACETLRNNELRRSLVYAIDRQKVLAETILRDPKSKRGRVVSAPFPSTSYAYQPLTPPRDHDLTLAYSLSLAAKKQFGGEIPPMVMICEPDPLVVDAAKKLIEQWSRVGIPITLREMSVQNGQDAGTWDLVYRTCQMAEPLIELWPFLTLETRARVASLSHLPAWLRQELIALDNAVDWNTAVQKLNDLHSQLAAEVELIPLWEVDDVVVMRKNIRGMPARPVHFYQNVEQWIIQPWYERETP